ncbi:MAG: NAD-binding protein, partial [Planctomycetes bacterium]|nr:NAD-binding protein [Planctomycetota bacterium]
DPIYVRDHFLLVTVALLVSVAVKAVIAAFALRIAGLSKRSAIGGGIMTAQMGEFSFVLAATAFGHGEPGSGLHGLYQLVVAVTCLSLAATPLLITVAVRFLPRSAVESIDSTGDTIVIAGLGPVGNTVVEALRDQGHPLLLVDRNRRLLAPWQDTSGVRCHFGRIEDMDDWLPTIGHRPCLEVLTFPIADTSALVTARLRAMDPELIIIARSPYEAQVELLRGAGAQFVICDERETTRALLPMLQEALAVRDSAATQTSRIARGDRPTASGRNPT